MSIVFVYMKIAAEFEANAPLWWELVYVLSGTQKQKHHMQLMVIGTNSNANKNPQFREQWRGKIDLVQTAWR